MISLMILIMVMISVVTALFCGNMHELSQGIMQGAQDGIGLIISICGNIILWSGILNIADKCGITNFIAKIISPFIHKVLFKNLKQSGKAMRDICMNISVNLIGLGNAATPIGISAMQNIEQELGVKNRASNEMIIFVVMNTASMQLIPTTAAFLRMQVKSQNPMEIFPCVIISSFISLCVGIFVAKLFSRVSGEKTNV